MATLERSAHLSVVRGRLPMASFSAEYKSHGIEAILCKALERSLSSDFAVSPAFAYPSVERGAEFSDPKAPRAQIRGGSLVAWLSRKEHNRTAVQNSH